MLTVFKRYLCSLNRPFTIFLKIDFEVPIKMWWLLNNLLRLIDLLEEEKGYTSLLRYIVMVGYMYLGHLDNSQF